MAATKAQIENFIAKIGPCAQVGYQEFGKVLPSVCIGMACIECGYGTAGSCKHHSYIGQKVGSGKTALKYWCGRFFKSKTKEEYKVGVHTVIVDAFRSYDSMQQCVLNYYELLNSKVYAKVKSGVDYKTQMQQIKACGYMTSSKEVNSVIKCIEKNHLKRYDVIGSGCTKKCTYPEPVSSRRVGNRGEGVMWIQWMLNNAGYNLVVDGIYGKKTQAAVTDFQKKQGLTIDGICGKQTRTRLKDVCQVQ